MDLPQNECVEMAGQGELESRLEAFDLSRNNPLRVSAATKNGRQPRFRWPRLAIIIFDILKRND
jgi:hypothetical protein